MHNYYAYKVSPSTEIYHKNFIHARDLSLCQNSKTVIFEQNNTPAQYRVQQQDQQ